MLTWILDTERKKCLLGSLIYHLHTWFLIQQNTNGFPGDLTATSTTQDQYPEMMSCACENVTKVLSSAFVSKITEQSIGIL